MSFSCCGQGLGSCIPWPLPVSLDVPIIYVPGSYKWLQIDIPCCHLEVSPIPLSWSLVWSVAVWNSRIQRNEAMPVVGLLYKRVVTFSLGPWSLRCGVRSLTMLLLHPAGPVSPW